MKHFGWSVRGRSACAVVFLSVAAMLAGATQVQAQDGGQGKYITEASVRLTKLVNASNAQGYKLHNNTFSIGGGWLKQGENNWVGLFTVQLTEGKEYRFLASGDADAKDVDLQIADPQSGKVFKEDASTAPDAAVDFTPQVSGRYLVRVRLYASEGSLPCVCLGIVMAK